MKRWESGASAAETVKSADTIAIVTGAKPAPEENFDVRISRDGSQWDREMAMLRHCLAEGFHRKYAC